MIMRELFEHYLRATGWTLSPAQGGWWPIRGWQIGTFEGVTDYEMSVQVSRLAKAEAKRIPAPLVGVRIGMCAVAERLLAESTRIRKAPDEPCGGSRGEELQRQAHGILRDLGIDPETCEATR